MRYMNGRLPYLNIGCGSKYHGDWVNVDLNPHSRDVMSYNILKSLPFPDETFEVIYHSQVLEHIPKKRALDFIRECRRVLKKNGIIRVVVPDLENIAGEYIKLLRKNLKSPSRESEANYDWIMLELYDQAVRDTSGGEMAEYLQQKKMINESYVIERAGYVARLLRERFLSDTGDSVKDKITRDIRSLGFPELTKKVLRFTKERIFQLFLGEKYRIGNFRMAGENHLWMYDRYSLSRLLKSAGFRNIKVKDPFISDISDWHKYELDVKEGFVFDPTSLFMEARK